MNYKWTPGGLQIHYRHKIGCFTTKTKKYLYSSWSPPELCHGTFQLLSCLCPSTLCHVQMKAVSSTTTTFIASRSFLKFVRVYTTTTSCLAWHVSSCYSTCKFSLFYFLFEYLLMFRLQRRHRFWLDVTSLKFRRVYHGHHLACELQQKRYWGHYHHLSSNWHGYKSRISRGMGTGTRICTPTKAVPVRWGLRFWTMYPFAAHNFRAVFQVSFIIQFLMVLQFIPHSQVYDVACHTRHRRRSNRHPQLSHWSISPSSRRQRKIPISILWRIEDIMLLPFFHPTAIFIKVWLCPKWFWCMSTEPYFFLASG